MLPIKLIALKHRSDGFDPVVYTKNRNFKCIRQIKVAQPVQEFIEGSKDDMDHLILHGIDVCKATDISTMTFGTVDLAAVMKKTAGKGKVGRAEIDILAIPQRNLPVPKDFDPLTAFPLDILAKLPNPIKGSPGWLTHSIVWSVMCWAKQSGITYDQFWQWNQQKDPAVERYARWRKDWDRCEYHLKDESMWAMLERTYPKIRETQVTKRFREQFNIKNVTRIDAEFMQKEHISHWLTCKFTVLLAAMGRNKTGAVVDYVVEHAIANNLSCLWISPRITLSQNTLQRLRDNGLAFTNYDDFLRKDKIAGALNDEDYLICSIQSLHYLGRNYDIIIADEWDTIAGTFSKDCKTHLSSPGNLVSNWSVWMSQLKMAKKVIFMDAFTTSLTENFLAHFGKTYEFVNLEKPPLPRQFVESDSFTEWIAAILTALENGEKIYDLMFEQNANKNYQNYETFYLFCDLANVTILPEDLAKVSKATRDYVDKLQMEAECCFDWDKIAAIPDDVPEEVILDLQALIWSDKATMDARLIYAKYCFTSCFKEDTDDRTLRIIWAGDVDLPSRMFKLKKDPTHTVNKLLTENGVVLDGDFEGFPPQMSINSVSLAQIQKQFHFHHPPRDYRTSLCARILQAYFEDDVYACKPVIDKNKGRKRKREETKQQWVYQTSERLRIRIQLGCPALKGFLVEQPVNLLEESDAKETSGVN
ncbi:hypothetical protein HKX48_009416 [Thoreauomyces humboldtii]|nr:hypothetical protein HKX48_009416 [Thoreauomyces humboldtii]